MGELYVALLKMKNGDKSALHHDENETGIIIILTFI